MKRILRTLLIVLAAGAAGIAGIYAGQTFNKPRMPEGVTATALPALMATSLPDADGVTHTLSDWRGKVLVVNFSIDSADNVRDFRTRFDVPYPLLVGSTDTLKLAAEFGNTARALPFTVIVGIDGRVQDVTLGTLSEAELRGKIESVLRP
jgi:peroxiredoxin